MSGQLHVNRKLFFSREIRSYRLRGKWNDNDLHLFIFLFLLEGAKSHDNNFTGDPTGHLIEKKTESRRNRGQGWKGKVWESLPVTCFTESIIKLGNHLHVCYLTVSLTIKDGVAMPL